MAKGRLTKTLVLSTWLLGLSVACGDGEEGRGVVRHGKAGEAVQVDGTDMTVGFARGKLRRVEHVDGFAIMKHPVTTGQYKKCEKAGACKAPALEECSNPELAEKARTGDPDSVALCVGYENAKRYCKWVDGRLPSLAEWLLAARGAEVKEHPWGEKPATCEQHPNAVSVSTSDQGEVVQTRCTDSGDGATRIGKHPRGASNTGAEDILLAPSELLLTAETTLYSACGKDQPCLIYGNGAGTIDSVSPYARVIDEPDGESESDPRRIAPMTYGFRCIFPE